MRKSLSALFAAVLLASFSTAPVLADPLIKSQVVCDLDDDGDFGGVGDGRLGVVKITDTGVFKFEMKDMSPITTYSCELHCANDVSGANPTGLRDSEANCGTTDGNGKADFTILNFTDPAVLCRAPSIRILGTGDQADDECNSGYGTDEVI